MTTPIVLTEDEREALIVAAQMMRWKQVKHSQEHWVAEYRMRATVLETLLARSGEEGEGK